MKVTLAILGTSFFLCTLTLGADPPSGQDSPEGVACDAVHAYAHCDAEAWLKTLIRPVYGADGNQEYENFKKQMVKVTNENKGKENFVPPRIVKVFEARNFSLNGPGSMAYALYEMTGNKFVDLVVDVGGGQLQAVRYHVLLDKDKKWYFEPRPDLASLLSAGLNEEPPSKKVLWELEISDSDEKAGSAD